MSNAELTLCVLAVSTVLFATEVIPLAVTAMGVAIVLGFLDIITPKEVFAGLSDPTVVLFAGMFVVGAAMFRTGLAKTIGMAIVKRAGTEEKRLMVAMMAVTIAMSSVSSNTATVACFMPVVIQICVTAGLPVSPQLMALAVAANVGGTITMIGTPPNILMSAALHNAEMRPFGFFEFAWIGIPLSVAGILYMVFVGRKLCPDRCSRLPGDSGAEEGESASGKSGKSKICAVILAAVVLAMVFAEQIHVAMEVSACIGALLCVITGCVTEKQAYEGIDWTTIFLFAGMLPLAKAMEVSGAGALIADKVVAFVGGDPSPYALAAALFLLSCGLTQFMSNTAAAALLAPIGISIAQSVGVSPYPVLMAIGIAASCAFTTPMATPPNTLVFGPGHFKFMDYVKVGIPLIVICLLVCLAIIPVVWPFH